MGLDFAGQPARIVTDRQIRLAECSLAIGTFDGVHRGHQQLIRTMVTEARSAGRPAVVWTFDPPPKVFFGRAERLASLEERLARIARIGPDYIVVAAFTALYAARPAESFIADLARIAPGLIHVGPDFRFGARQGGDIALLARHFDVAVARPVLCGDGETISSTRIRTLKAKGRPGAAADLLGTPSSFGLLAGGQQAMDIRQREEFDVWI